MGTDYYAYATIGVPLTFGDISTLVDLQQPWASKNSTIETTLPEAVFSTGTAMTTFEKSVGGGIRRFLSLG